MVLLDYGSRSAAARRRWMLTLALWLVGLRLFVYGIWALWPWVS